MLPEIVRLPLELSCSILLAVISPLMNAFWVVWMEEAIVLPCLISR